jgi:hypothetical protein
MIVLTISAAMGQSQDQIRAKPQVAPKDEPSGSTPKSVNRRGRVRPVTPGVSIGSEMARASTLTCIVKDKDGVEYALLANYIFGSSPKEGDPVRQPGLADGGTGDDVVAKLSKFTRVDPSKANRAAGAIAKLEPGTAATNDIPDLGPVTGVGRVAVGQIVRMYGRTSGATIGVVTSIELNGVQISFAGIGLARFDDMIVVQGVGGSFSRPGDGGAPVVDQQGRLVGMVYGGAGDGRQSFVLPIGPTLEALGVEVAGVAAAQAVQQPASPQAVPVMIPVGPPTAVSVTAPPPVGVPVQFAQPIATPTIVTASSSPLFIRVGEVVLNPARIDYIAVRDDEVSVYIAGRGDPLKLPRREVEASQLLQRIAPAPQ